MNSGKRSNQQNVDNIDVLTERVNTFQPAYDPAETRLSIDNQKKIKTSGDEVLLGVAMAESACDNTTSARTAAFDALSNLVTRVINALRISDVEEQTIAQGEAIVRELRNKRASKVETPVKTAEGDENKEPVKINKLRRGSFNTRIENFRKFIVFLSAIPAYNPKQTDLTIDALKVKLEALVLVNSAFTTAEAKAEAARLQRDIVLYREKTGLVAIALDSKLYVKSAYGATSPQYKSISGILFTRPR
jgi:hypothetical protein